jgi:hypothetical protein
MGRHAHNPACHVCPVSGATVDSVQRTLTGTNPDGSPHYTYTIEPADLDANGEFHVVNTGRAMGLVQLADGATYDVTDAYIAVASPEHATEVHHHIGVQLERSGALDIQGLPFTHTDCGHCDAPTTGDDEPHSPQAVAQVEALGGLAPRVGG